MGEVLLLVGMLLAAYWVMPSGRFSQVLAMEQLETASLEAEEMAAAVPEDSVLRRHFITQVRSEIEQDLFPRPTDFNLQRHYDSLVEAELQNRLAPQAA